MEIVLNGAASQNGLGGRGGDRTEECDCQEERKESMYTPIFADSFWSRSLACAITSTPKTPKVVGRLQGQRPTTGSDARRQLLLAAVQPLSIGLDGSAVICKSEQ